MGDRFMRILSYDPSEGVLKFDERLKARIESRKQELLSVKGIKRVYIRVKIELWAWKETLRERYSKSEKNGRII